MSSPANPALSSGISEIQRPTRISLERIHDKFRRNVRIDHNVYVVGAHLRGDQPPLFVSAHFKDRFESKIALIVVHLKGRLLHPGLDILAELCLRFPQPGTRHVMVAVCCAFLSRKVRSVAGERNEIYDDN